MKVVYTQELCHGVGVLEIDGVKVENLVWMFINSHTDTDELQFSMIEFAYLDGDVIRRDRISGGL